MKGILLAGGSGTRLHPLTKVISKQLLPIYDKPMIYYSLSVLMLAGIREILLISTERDLPGFKELLGNGEALGLNIQYKIQFEPKGIAEALIIGESFIDNSSVCLVLGDNLFYAQGLTDILKSAAGITEGALIFGYYVNNPSDFGVVSFDPSGKVLSLEEKPAEPVSNYAVPGLYFYDKKAVAYAQTLKPSKRGELEITDLNLMYLSEGTLKVKLFGRGTAWLDTGSFRGLMEAGNFVESIQTRQGLYIAAIEEIAYRMGYINKEKLVESASKQKNSEYGKYLLKIANE